MPTGFFKERTPSPSDWPILREIRIKFYAFARNFASKGREGRLYPCVSPFFGGGVVMLHGLRWLGDLRKQTLEKTYNSKRLKEIQQLHLSGQGDQMEIYKNCATLYRSTLSR